MSTPVHLRLDSDDPCLDHYRKMKYPSNWTINIGDRASLSKYINSFYVDCPGLAWYGFLADDVVPETAEWDVKLIEAAGECNLAYAYDGKHEKSFAAHFVLGGKLVESIGWLALPNLHRIYIDTVWNDIARARKALVYLPDVRLIHHHFSNGLAERDKTYHKPNNPEDRLTYIKWSKAGV